LLIFRSFPQENEKNNREPLISVKLISGSLNHFTGIGKRMRLHGGKDAAVSNALWSFA